MRGNSFCRRTRRASHLSRGSATSFVDAERRDLGRRTLLPGLHGPPICETPCLRVVARRLPGVDVAEQSPRLLVRPDLEDLPVVGELLGPQPAGRRIRKAMNHRVGSLVDIPSGGDELEPGKVRAVITDLAVVDGPV